MLRWLVQQLELALFVYLGYLAGRDAERNKRRRKVATQQYPLHVEMEDGKDFDVLADQRDVARWELQSFGGPVTEARLKWNTFARFLAWSAATRAGTIDCTWDVFEKTAVEVNERTEDRARDDAENPGREAASEKP